MRKKILILNRFFLPAYKAGGPIKSLKILIQKVLIFKSDLYVACKDRDFQDKYPFKKIKKSSWNNRYGIKILYINSFLADFFKINFKKYDLIYLNSFFDFYYTFLPLIYIKIFLKKNLKIILNPRGELSPETLKIKKIRKILYIYVVKFFKLLDGVYFHLTNYDEQKFIKNILKNKTVVIPNLSDFKILKKNSKQNSEDRYIYLSRITPKKNLLKCIQILKKIKTNYRFDIYGPIDDQIYWNKCKNLINLINKDTKRVFYKGILETSKTKQTLKNYDLFLFLTQNENFSHAIFESLQSNVPVLTSKSVYWKKLKKYNLGWNVNLFNDNAIIKILNNFNIRKKYLKKSFQKNLSNYLKVYYDEKKIIKSYKEVFLDE